MQGFTVYKHSIYSTRKMVTMCNKLQLDSVKAFYYYLIDSYINGQHKQFYELYDKMPKVNKHEFKEVLKDFDSTLYQRLF